MGQNLPRPEKIAPGSWRTLCVATCAQILIMDPMEPAHDLTLLDYWPIGALALVLVFVVIGVARGLRRPADGSKNKPNIGGGPGGD